MKTLTIFAIAVLLSITSFAQERFVKPVDQAAQDASFVVFRKKLIAAAEKRDIRYVKSIMDRNIKLSFGGHEGVKDFDELWPDKNKFWREFLKVLKNGGHWHDEGRKKKSLFTAPYTFNGFPEELDVFEHFSIFGNNVNLRRTPSVDGEIVGSLSYNVVKLDDDDANRQENGAWFKITTLGGKSGYISREFVRSPIDHRAGFEKVRGQWKMTFFIAGD